ncbi:MAG: hypothetical protein HYU67_04655 [Flavobacteriia bacterium]|nr:hypothetical protein [Flavobacteriia bacterium]
MKKIKKYKWLILVVLLLLVLYFWYKNKNKTSESFDTSTTSNNQSNSLPSIGSNTTLKRGAKAKEVQQLQSYYNTKIANPTGVTRLTEDGIFGPKTESVVQSVMGRKSTTLNEFISTLNTANQITTNTTQDNFPWIGNANDINN